MTRTLAAFPLLLLVAACARSEDPADVRVDENRGYNQIGRVNAPEQDDRAPAIGQWQQSLQDNAPALVFGPIGTQPLFSLLCTGRQSVLLQRHGGAPDGPLPQLRLAIGGQEANLAVTRSAGSIPMLRAELPLTHPLVQALGQGSQPLTERFGEDSAPVIIPGSPMVGDYLRSCATAQPIAAANGNLAAPANSAAPVANGAEPSNGAAIAPSPAPVSAAGNAARPKQ
jgi:hypothetical protein